MDEPEPDGAVCSVRGASSDPASEVARCLRALADEFASGVRVADVTVLTAVRSLEERSRRIGGANSGFQGAHLSSKQAAHSKQCCHVENTAHQKQWVHTNHVHS